MRRIKNLIILLLIAILLNHPVTARDREQTALLLKELSGLSLEDLMQVTVQAASGIEETLRQAPAAMIIISQQDIIERGYSSLDEVIGDLPGFDVIVGGGSAQMTAYQRGYRTPFTQRTLFMVNGMVDNHLYTQNAVLSRQYPLSNVERIEVLYGPSSVVYGANAFSGVINVISKDAKELKKDEHHLEVTTQLGSFNSRAVEIAALGKQQGFSYNISARWFDSDEAGLDDYPKKWDFADSRWLNDKQAWGAMLGQEQHGVKFGEYYDPSRNWGIVGEAHYGDFTLGLIAWETQESYGPYYAFDRVQPNILWNNDSRQYYLQHKTQAIPKLHLTTLAAYRQNRIWGGWVEAIPDWDTGKERDSYLSFSQWNAQNNSWLFSQDYDYTWTETLRVTGGIKYQQKRLTDVFDICSYWSESFCSNDAADDEGAYGFGPGVFHSSDPVAVIKPAPLSTMPESNLLNTTDIGGYVQGIWAKDPWRFNAGLRYDENNRYGSVVTPRFSAIYQASPSTTLKLLYGQAFQEPSQIQLGGGWSGRIANPNLQAEHAENLELVLMYQAKHWLHDLSLFKAHYSDVIKEESENAGQRDIIGMEYRGRYAFPNFIKGAPDIHGYVYYTFTHVDSSIYYDHTAQKWLEGTEELGDIAPHKFNLGITLPYNDKLFINLRANLASSRKLYLRNPLRVQGEEAEAYALLHLNLGYRTKQFNISFKINNLLNKGYLQPGLEQADAGNNFEQRSLGFRNSLVPGVGRTYGLSFSWKFK